MPVQPQKPMINQVKVMPLSQHLLRSGLVKQEKRRLPAGRVDAYSKPQTGRDHPKQKFHVVHSGMALGEGIRFGRVVRSLMPQTTPLPR